MRVLLVYYEPQPSGQTRHVLSLARGLNRRGHHSIVVLPKTLEASITALRQVGVEVVPLPLRRVMWTPQALARLARLVREEEIDVVHVHSQAAGIPARVVAWLAGAQRILYTPQTIDIRRHRWHRLYVLLERILTSITDVIISVNELDRRRLIQWGIPPHKVVTVANGVDLGEFGAPSDKQGLRRALGLDAERPLVLQVGRLRTQKDPLAFAEGAAKVLRMCPDAQFALVGDGPLGDRVAAYIQELKLERSVHLVGWVAGASKLMAAADVVTLTSHWEGMPYVLLEAMGWSRPVVATAVNGCPEVVVHGLTGWLVQAGDTAAWARSVASLLNDPVKATEMGVQGRRRLEERFSLQEMISRVETLYRS